MTSILDWPWAYTTSTRYDRYNALLERVTYLPHVRFEVDWQGWLWTSYETVCVRTGEPFSFNWREILAPDLTDREFFAAVLGALSRAEEHERHERFLVGGVPFVNPHPEITDYVPRQA